MNENTPAPLAPSSQDNEIILYQPDSTVKLEVRLENETVWLTQQQIADLFGTKRPAITKHLANIYKSGELEENSTCSILEHMGNDGTQRYATKYYNLDAILSVGYRVNSRNATLFRQWANKVLKEYLLRGYSINQRLMHMENRIDHRLSEHDIQIKELSNRMDFFVRTSLPPKEGIIYDGQIFDAYTLMCDLIRSARNRIVIVDNYIDDSVFRQLDKRATGVSATIFTPSLSRALRQDLERHNAQYPPIEVKTFRRAHDRFLIIDDTVYHVGASFKDLGKKLTAFSKMEIMTADELITYLES
ncbi:MAG: virulence RhuM family protein [Muribaculaceae bacterium]|nr:virulence RhuM family protein [Muribaculaceae bacterium]